MKPVLHGLLILLILGGTACVHRSGVKAMPESWSPETALKPVTPFDIGNLQDRDALRSAMQASLDYYRALPADIGLIFGPDRHRAADLALFFEDLLAKLDEPGPAGRFGEYLRQHAKFYVSSAESVLVTGYYEIRLAGSRTFSPEYSHPVYRRPADLLRIPLRPFLSRDYTPQLPDLLRARLTREMEAVPYYTRRDIDRLGELRGQGLEICWIRDPYRLFFLHIQGSGIVQFEDGSELNLNYADTNGHPYRSIGRELIDRYGVDPDTLSMQGIYTFLSDNPQLADEIMDHNASYVFFRTVEKGPIGSLGRALTPTRSIATDSRLFPKGALAFLETELPEFNSQGKPQTWKPWRGLVLNQDTGGAIRGPGRVDWFIGSDAASEQVAGHLKQPGRLFFLAPRKR